MHSRAGEHVGATRAELGIAAHHLLEGCTQATAPVAAAVARDATVAAMSRLAFETAASLASRALEALTPRASEHAELACELEILRAEAIVRAGDVTQGRERCIHAASLARTIKSATLEARAALAYGAHVSSGGTDPRMIALLRGALDALSRLATGNREDDALRARVMARLAAAMMPPPTDQLHRHRPLYSLPPQRPNIPR